jgi:hypothetical protein
MALRLFFLSMGLLHAFDLPIPRAIPRSPQECSCFSRHRLIPKDLLTTSEMPDGKTGTGSDLVKSIELCWSQGGRVSSCKMHQEKSVTKIANTSACGTPVPYLSTIEFTGPFQFSRSKVPVLLKLFAYCISEEQRPKVVDGSRDPRVV